MAKSEEAPQAPYTPQYKTVTTVGHTRPTQEIGSPALVWHVAVWPKRASDPQHVKPQVPDIDVDERGAAYEAAVNEHNSRRRKLFIGKPERMDGKFETLNELLAHLQSRARTDRERDQEREVFELAAPSVQDDDAGRATTGEAEDQKSKVPLQFIVPEAIGFTLWWRDRVDGKPDQRRMKRPGYEPLRVRVQVEAQIDYFALTFLIDVGNPWNAGQVFSAGEAPGERRKTIFKHVEKVRETCEAELVPGNTSLEEPLVPLDRVSPPLDKLATEDDLNDAIEKLREEIKNKSASPESTKALLAASKYLYAGIWNEFCEDFGFRFEDIAGPNGLVFANFRGLVMSTGGADYLPKEPSPTSAGMSAPPGDTPTDGPTAQSGLSHKAYSAADHKMTATPGKEAFRKFAKDGAEPNAVVKAYWPFIRRIKPFADYREYIACGVFNWRALYITALGSQSEYDSGDESEGREYEVPAGNLPELADEHGKIWLRRRGAEPLAEDPLLGSKGEEPVRYLLLTKCEPHRRQLGRIIDRIDALGTMRLFALKGWSDIYEASEHIRMRGQQLDQVMAKWIRERLDINARFDDADERNRQLARLNTQVELQLIHINAALDGLGDGVVGGLPYRLARSRYYARRFDQMRETLSVGNIESWTSYDQFATRGLRPVFDFIEAMADRLSGLRQRLAVVMQSIQTSALVAQTEETRKNTRALELLNTPASGLTIAAIWGVFFAALQPLKALAGTAVSYCKTLALPVIPQLSPACELHTKFFGDTPDTAYAIYVAIAIFLGLLLSIVIIAEQFASISFRAGVLILSGAATVAFAIASLVRIPADWLPSLLVGEWLQTLGHVSYPVALACLGLLLLWVLAHFILGATRLLLGLRRRGASQSGMN